MKATRSAQLVLAIVATMWSANATAISCIPLEDRFFVQCRAGECRGILRARDVSGTYGCARRFQVESVPPWMASEISRIAALSNWETGLHSITYEYDFAADPRSLKELRLATHSVEPVLTVLDGTESSLRTALAQRQAAERWAKYWHTLIELLVGIAVLVLMVWSSRSFWQKVREGTRASGLLTPLSIQAGLMLAAAVWAPFGLMSGSGWALIIGVPVVMLLLIVEIAAFILISWFRRRVPSH